MHESRRELVFSANGDGGSAWREPWAGVRAS